MTSFGPVKVLSNPAQAAKEDAYGERARAVISRGRFEEAVAEISNWPGYQPTPLVSLPGLAEKTGVASH